jgi:Cu/Zn superoxide dismutase
MTRVTLVADARRHNHRRFEGKPAVGSGIRASQSQLNSCTDGAVVSSATLVESPSSEGSRTSRSSYPYETCRPGTRHIHEVGACTPCSAAESPAGPFGNNLPVTANHPYRSGDLINVRPGRQGTGSWRT